MSQVIGSVASRSLMSFAPRAFTLIVQAPVFAVFALNRIVCPVA